MWCERKILPALSVSSDVKAIKPSHYSCWPHQWALRELRMKTDGLPTATPSSVQPPPTVYPEGIQDGERQVILAPDSWGAYHRNDFSEPRLPFFHTQKSAKFLNWDIWFSIINSNLLMFFSWASLVVQMVKCLPAIRETQVPWIGNIPWRRKCQPTPVLLPGKSHEQRSLVGCSPWGHKELDMAEWLHFSHSDVLDRLCCKNSYISWLQPLPLWSCLSELSEMLCPRFEVLRISTKYSIILNV